MTGRDPCGEWGTQGLAATRSLPSGPQTEAGLSYFLGMGYPLGTHHTRPSPLWVPTEPEVGTRPDPVSVEASPDRRHDTGPRRTHTGWRGTQGVRERRGVTSCSQTQGRDARPPRYHSPDLVTVRTDRSDFVPDSSASGWTRSMIDQCANWFPGFLNGRIGVRLSSRFHVDRNDLIGSDTEGSSARAPVRVAQLDQSEWGTETCTQVARVDGPEGPVVAGGDEVERLRSLGEDPPGSRSTYRGPVTYSSFRVLTTLSRRCVRSLTGSGPGL